MNFPPVNCYASQALIEFGKPQRGDIIVFRFPEDEEKDFIKRIVGTPGDTVQLRNKAVLVNGVVLDDKSFTQRIDPGIIDGTINPRDNFGPVTVPEGVLFRDGRQSRPKSGQPVLGVRARRKNPREGVPYLLVVERARSMDGVGQMGSIRQSHPIGKAARQASAGSGTQGGEVRRPLKCFGSTSRGFRKPPCSSSATSFSTIISGAV